MIKQKGSVVYEGVSPFNGRPIVGILTGFNAPSTNPKTGPMLQLYILDRDEAPHILVKEGRDGSVCGNCPYSKGQGCYVAAYRGPLAVWKAYKKGNYHDGRKDLSATLSHIRKRNHSIRLGAYGDSAMLPFSLVSTLAQEATRTTGYTHQWREGFYEEQYNTLLMRSVESVEDISSNTGQNRTFRVGANEEDVKPGEILCPNFTKEVQCIDCGLCAGASKGTKNIVIPAHGISKKKLLKQLEVINK